MIQQKAAEQGSAALQLEVLVNNAPALRLYQALGYTARRNLLFWRATPEVPGPGAAAGELAAGNVYDFIDTLFRWQVEPPAWQRTQRSVARYLGDMWGYVMHSRAEPVGYVACLPTAL